MQVDDPPYLSVGTAVSAKYKGAFCEAKVHKLVRCVKCKVTYKTGLGTATVTDSEIKGPLRTGHVVQVKHPNNAKEYVEATITKMQDCSQYTVVFDDGDITTLRRTALCLKSGRHFNESETLDQLPLTNPEHFGNPVVGGRRGRRNRQIKEDSSDGEPEEENEPDLEGYRVDIGRVRMYEITDKKRNKESWFPGLVVIPSSASTTDKINIKEEYLIRSFKDGRYYTVPKKETRDFNRELEIKSDSSAVLTEAVQKALRYLDHNELPVHWERSSLFSSQQQMDSDSEENFSDSSDDEPSEEKDRFVAQLYKFLDDAGTPLNKTPSINGRDIDLHRLFRLVHKLGGYNRVTNQSKWKSVTMGLKLTCNQNVFNQVKSVYKKCLISYENFNRALGVTMLNHTRSTKKNSGRSLIRDKDRATPVNSPRPEKEDEMEKREEPKPSTSEPKGKKLKKEEDKRKKETSEVSDTNSSGDATDQSESSKRPKRTEGKSMVITKEKKGRPVTGEKVKALVEKFEEQSKKEEDKVQQTRSKTSTKLKEPPTPEKKPEKVLVQKEAATKVPSTSKPVKKIVEEEKKKGRKKSTTEDKLSTSDSSASESTTSSKNVNIGDKLKVYYGPTNESKVTYEAKVVQIGKDASGIIYFVHYTGWNTRYDEWIIPGRIAENLSASSKAKRLKQNQNASKSSSNASAGPAIGKTAAKRSRGQSITGKEPTPRSTTPSSVTSNTSRTKSPATPATRSASRLQIKQDYSRKSRRTSSQTDISIHSESESERSDSEVEELTRTRSGKSTEEPEIRTYKRKVPKVPIVSKRKDDDDTEKDEEPQLEKTKTIKRPKRMKKASEKSADESDDDDSSNPPKGRDFDLNQIRSELKGFSKPVSTSEVSEKDAVSSSDDSTIPPPEKVTAEEVEEKVVEKTPEKVTDSSEDIYEFKEPEPFEFESKKRLVGRLFDDLDKSPKKEVEKKQYTRSPVKKAIDSDVVKKDDPFDSLVQSPSFNYVKTSKVSEIKSCDLFNDLNDQMDDYSTGDMDLSDSESQSTNIFSREPSVFEQASPDHNTMDMDFSNSAKTDECKLKDSDDDENIREQVQMLIARSSSTDEESNEPLLITPTSSSYQARKREIDEKPLTILGITAATASVTVTKEIEPEEEEESPPHREPSPMELDTEPLENKPIMEKVVFIPIKSHISPALQETDSSLLESIVGSPVIVPTNLEETIKKPSSSKIADSILQKFNSIKKLESKSPKREVVEEVKKESEEEIKPKVNIELKQKPTVDMSPEMKVFTIKPFQMELKPKVVPEIKALREIKPEIKVKPEVKPEVKVEIKKPVDVDLKKRKKVVSRAYIDDSDSDSSDSEQLVIARSDDEEEEDEGDSQSNSMDVPKPDTKESDSNVSQIASTDDSQSQEEERNFKFDPIKPESPKVEIVTHEETKEDSDAGKEEEPDSNFHSLLLCEETIPRSPAPAPEVPSIEDLKPSKSVLEMPFASAPGTSNVKNIIIEQKIVPKPQPIPVVMPLMERDVNREREVENVVVNRRTDASAVLDNTPPTTPESTLSNLSPRGENGGLSPNAADNESCKSNDVDPDFGRLHRTTNQKVSPYSEEDTQMTSTDSVILKKRDDGIPGGSKKRRRSCRAEDVPLKRGRKPLNRARHNSDSDDTSEHSTTGSTNVGTYDLSERAPRPTKYNFIVDLDPSLDSAQRIALLQQQMSELKKTYVDVKAELALVERRRKKIRRREREALKASKQEALVT